jgi:hypothetical protein
MDIEENKRIEDVDVIFTIGDYPYLKELIEERKLIVKYYRGV